MKAICKEQKAFNMLNKIFRKQKTIHNVFSMYNYMYLCINSNFTQLKKVIRRHQCNGLKLLEIFSSKKKSHKTLYQTLQMEKVIVDGDQGKVFNNVKTATVF